MREYMIINAVPVYNEAPISLDILKENYARILDQLKRNQAKKTYLLINKKEQALILKMEEYIKEIHACIHIIPVDAEDNFVYSNGSAAKKVIEGEKPIPCETSEPVFLNSVEKLLSINEKIVYVDGKVPHKGSFTFQTYVKPEDILKKCGPVQSMKAIYFGYPMGIFIKEEDLDKEIELTTDYIKIFDNSDCILNQLSKIMSDYEKETCGRCVYGYEGVTQINRILADIALKKGKSEDLDLLQDLCEIMKMQSLCEIGKVAAQTVLSAITGFGQEIFEHITRKTCNASVCKKFITFHILEGKCSGCTKCETMCEEEAIRGKKNFIHIIDQDECIQCGTCKEVCEYDAIVTAGAVKPRSPKKPLPCKKKKPAD